LKLILIKLEINLINPIRGLIGELISFKLMKSGGLIEEISKFGVNWG